MWPSVVDSIFFIFMENKNNENAICDIPVCLYAVLWNKISSPITDFCICMLTWTSKHSNM